MSQPGATTVKGGSRGRACVATALLIVSCSTACGVRAPSRGESATPLDSGLSSRAPMACAAATGIGTIAFACGSSSPLEAACSVRFVPGETTLKEVRQLLAACGLVDPAATYEGSWYAIHAPGAVQVNWMCWDWRRSEDALISNGYPHRIVAKEGVVEWLLWRFDTTARCSPTASDVVELYGAPEKVLWALAGYTPEMIWGDAILLYPSKGLVFEVAVTGHTGPVHRGDAVMAAYVSVPASLDDLVRGPVQFDWHLWDFDRERVGRRSTWAEKLEDWPGFDR